jgi:hypothetical protein
MFLMKMKMNCEDEREQRRMEHGVSGGLFIYLSVPCFVQCQLACLNSYPELISCMMGYRCAGSDGPSDIREVSSYLVFYK